MTREEARALDMRERSTQRTRRFLNAKQRTIGIDKHSLDQQVQAKNEMLEQEKERELDYARRQEELCMYLDEQALIKEQNKMDQLRDVKDTLDEQLSLPKNNAIAMGSLDLDRCGSSSLQFFAGEDHECESRIKDQQSQLRQWCSRGIYERETKRRQEEETEEDYAKYVFEEDKARCAVACEEQNHRKKVQRAVMEENLRLANEHQRQKVKHVEQERRLEEKETRHIFASPFFCEDTDYARSAVADHRVRPDHFKGFTKEEIKHTFMENDNVVAEKEELKRCTEDMEKDWAMEQNKMVEQMDTMERRKQEAIASENKLYIETINKQRDESKQKKQEMDRDRFGAVGNGFFQKFGTSCR